MKVNLLEICTPKQWKTLATCELLESGKYDVYGANGIIGKYDEYNHEFPTVLITCRGATCGNVHLSKPFSYINGNAMALDNLDETKCLNKYLYYYLKGIDLSNSISGSAQPQITIHGLKKINIKLYDLNRQNEIVTNLSKIDNLINLKNNQIYKLEQLVKSQFVEMFGEPLINNKKWKNGTINDLIIDAKYGTSRPSINGGKYKYLRMNNITYDGKLDIKDLKYIDIPDNELDKYTTKRGDILFNRTNSRDLVGKTCVYNLDEKMVIAGFIIRVRTNQLANPYFISAYLNTSILKEKLYSMCKNASGQSNINAQELKNIEIYIPPIELQNKFAKIVEQIDKQKFVSEKMLEIIGKLSNLW